MLELWDKNLVPCSLKGLGPITSRVLTVPPLKRRLCCSTEVKSFRTCSCGLRHARLNKHQFKLKVSEAKKKKKLLKPIHGSISLGSTGTFMQESCQHPVPLSARNLDAGRVLRKLWVLEGPCFFACVSATSFCKRRSEKA